MKKTLMAILLAFVCLCVTSCDEDTEVVVKDSLQVTALRARYNDWISRETFPEKHTTDLSDENVLRICKETMEEIDFTMENTDYWQESGVTESTGKGDREDIAILAYCRLIGIGICPKSMDILIAESPEGARAYVLLVRNKYYYLDEEDGDRFVIGYKFGKGYFTPLDEYETFEGYEYGGV